MICRYNDFDKDEKVIILIRLAKLVNFARRRGLIKKIPFSVCKRGKGIRTSNEGIVIAMV